VTDGHEFSIRSISAEPRKFRFFAPKKRLLDLAIAISTLVVTSPILVLAMVLIWCSDPGTVLFRQVRVGRNGRPFTMLKLRTMYLDNDDSAFRKFNTGELLGGNKSNTKGIFKLENDPRVLPVGRFFRRFSIDELPQLLNVLRGNMSVVGPRPSLLWEVKLFTQEQQRRHDVPPGMTGLWQVSGRNRLSMQQMLALDLAYVDRQSTLLDLKILWRTLPTVLKGETS
jgi:lipopolysaccharide/colanic/teichoic acid biosynthesis glycosyltransferase